MYNSPNLPIHLPDDYETPPIYSRGRQARRYSINPLFSALGASPFPAKLLVPESEWIERIKEKDAKKSWPSDLWRTAGLPPLDQNGTNYCWTNAVVTCLQSMRLFNNLPPTKFSSASVAAPIKNFSNSGGWGGEALAYIVEKGILPIEKWPANAIDRQYHTAESKLYRLRFRIKEWYDLLPRSFSQLASCLLNDIPVAIGLNWWSHEVAAMALRIKNDQIVVEILNSWGDWGTNGFATLTRAKATPDDACAVVVPYASIA